MAEIAAILVAVGLFIAAFATWYTSWQRRMADSCKRVPVRTDRSAPFVPRGADLPGDSHR
jgi:hypothetical protein